MILMYYIDHIPIEKVTATKFLGVADNNKLSWVEHINSI